MVKIPDHSTSSTGGVGKGPESKDGPAGKAKPFPPKEKDSKGPERKVRDHQEKESKSSADKEPTTQKQEAQPKSIFEVAGAVEGTPQQAGAISGEPTALTGISRTQASEINHLLEQIVGPNGTVQVMQTQETTEMTLTLTYPPSLASAELNIQVDRTTGDITIRIDHVAKAEGQQLLDMGKADLENKLRSMGYNISPITVTANETLIVIRPPLPFEVVSPLAQFEEAQQSGGGPGGEGGQQEGRGEEEEKPR